MKVYKKLFGYLPHEGIIGYISIALSGISAFLMIYGYYYIYLFLKEVMVSGNLENANAYSIRIVGFLTISAILYLLSGLTSHKLAFRLETNLRKRGIDGLTDASFRFFDLYSSGYIRKSIEDNAAKTHNAVAHMLPDNTQAFLLPVLICILAYVISARVGTVIVVLSIVSGIILSMMIGNKEFMKLYQASLDRLSAETVEYIRGIQVVKIFGTQLKSFKALHQAIQDYARYAYEYSLSCKVPYVLYQLLFLSLIAIIAIPLSFFLTSLKEPEVMALELIMIAFLSGAMMVAFMKIMWASMHIYHANYAMDQLEDLYTKMQADTLSYGTRTAFEHDTIEFHDVSFAYGEKKVLENLSFRLEEKKIYALVGHSGSGKSTIAKLLSGFYKVDGGSIKIGGYPLEEYTKEAIIKNISFVFQDSKLFKTSIYDNVAIADEQASREEVMDAMRLAGCDEILAKLKEKEHTIIGSKGIYLSGGEKQRIAIARAILKKSPIVIMDEAAASIDTDHEYALQQAFKNLMQNKTVILIAHRMSSIKNVDEILVLEKGEIVERGNHESLSKKQGVYNRLLELYETANDWRVSNEELL